MNVTSHHPSPLRRRGLRTTGGLLLVCTAMLAGSAAAEAKKCTDKGGRGVDVLKGTKKKDVLCGKGGDDVLIGKAGNDVLKGGAGTDSLTGKSGDDSLAGGPGDDTLTGGKGNDKFKGQAGVDVAGLAGSPAPLVVDLAAGTASGDGDDTLLAVENVTGSAFDDRLVGDAGPNRLSGGDGNDEVIGLQADDVLEGQGGVDSTSYAPLANPVSADLRAGTVTGDGTDAISGIENLTGTAHDDTIAGDDADNVLDGGSGRDTISFAGAPAAIDANLGAGTATGDGSDALTGFEDLSGSENADRLAGDGAGNRIAGAGGDDTLAGEGGDDTFEGGAGSDTASYADAANPIEADLRAGAADGQGHDALVAVERLLGSPRGDTLAGDAGANVLDGGGGQDTVTFAGSPNGVIADLTGGATSGDGADTLLGFANAIGSAQADSITGTPGDNAIAAGNGDDTISAGDGNDRITGENGQDSLFGDAADDDIFGGPGDDLLDGGTGANNCDGGTGINTFAGNCDGSPPAVTTIAIEPDSVDTSGAARTVDFTISLDDPGAGVDAAASSVLVHAPAGAPSFSDQLDLDSGGPQSGTYTASITLPRFSAQGTWTVDLQVADLSGNQELMTSADLAAAGLEHAFEQTGSDDTESPTLTSFSAAPHSIDTSTAPAAIGFDLTATDDLAGIDQAASMVVVNGPGGQQAIETSLQLVSGTPTNGAYHASVTIPRYSPQGTWTVGLLLVDAAANETLLTPAELGPDGSFTQTGPGDAALPTLTAFNRTPAQINTAQSAQRVDVTLAATDALSGIDATASKIVFTDSVNQPGGERALTRTSGTPEDGTYSASITIPRGSATGTWKIRLELVDQAGNIDVFNSTDLAAAGFPGTFENVAGGGT